jgi:hypothetical protein
MMSMELSELQGKIVQVVIPVKGVLFSMNLKVCRVKVRSLLFIEVIKPERKNVFRKVSMKMLDSFDESTITFKEGTVVEKFESSWDSIGQPSPMVANSFGSRPFSNHSKGWSSNAPQYRSTTNSAVGFPMV